ncbi:F-type H+-transporting ATPase subunit beta [Oceanobacillus limi]|uniref:F-type H+-transporting ATPase subunit beta n=1 Tax=Oceanobacillus limi TaxID=930131 RepID=A0A1H9Y0X7_9BACI|nr:hypothetical protein [Oceanobacillus limi]SES62327.1 F-type H+-transporting ATPase subunit beta [Oceanobacillus limi]
MDRSFKLNTHLLKKRVPNLTVAAKNEGLRPATVSNLTTGKIPIGRAEVRTLVALSKIADCTLDELLIFEDETEKIETGIKTIDLFAPFVRGGTAGLVAQPGMGQLVLLAELFYRMRRLNFYTILFMPNEAIQGIDDATSNADCFCSNVDDILRQIETVNAEQDILIGVDRSILLSGDLNEFKERMNNEVDDPITYLIVDTTGQAVDDDSLYGPLESLWSFDMDLATRNMFPAINPVNSTSTLLENEYLEASHVNSIRAAKKLLRRYRELAFLVDRFGETKLADRDRVTYHRGLRLEAFFTQPFYITEPFTKKTGVWVSLQDTIKDVQSIMDGKADQLAVDELMYRGGI